CSCRRLPARSTRHAFRFRWELSVMAKDSLMRVGANVDTDLHTMRHSCAHLMAAAIQRLWPAAKFGVGPAISNGFYYDVMFDEPIGDDDLMAITEKMKELHKQALPYRRDELSVDAAIAEMKKLGQPFKVELLNLLKEKGSTAVAKETGDSEVVAPEACAKG